MCPAQMVNWAAVQPRRLIDADVTPDGEPIELVFEAGHYVVRLNGVPLMSSAMHGSEQAMARVAAEHLKGSRAPRILIGGLGLGFTARAALDSFSSDARITVAELLPAVVRFNRGELGTLTGRPLADKRVNLAVGDVRDSLSPGSWDAVLLDVDNGPEAFTVADNANLYRGKGLRRVVDALRPNGVLVVWSAFPSPAFERELRRTGLRVESKRVRARASGKGPRHTLFIGRN